MRKLSLTLVTVLFAQLFLVVSDCLSDDIYIIVNRKQEQKSSSRWSLSDWMLTKQKMALMDQWLLLHSSPTIFEGILGGDMGDYDLTYEPGSLLLEEKTHRLKRGELKLFFAFFGIGGHFEKSKESYEAWDAGIYLRLLGATSQGTNITLNGGVRSLKETLKYQNGFVGGSLTINLFSFLGAEGLYRYYFEGDSGDKTITLRGKKLEGTAFLDLSFLRLYGTIYKEHLIYSLKDNSEISVTKKREGVLYGIKIFF